MMRRCGAAQLVCGPAPRCAVPLGGLRVECMCLESGGVGLMALRGGAVCLRRPVLRCFSVTTPRNRPLACLSRAANALMQLS